MAAALDATGDEAFGLKAAAYLQPQMLQALGLSWLSSDSIYDGLKRMSRFAHCLNSGMAIRLVEEGDVLHAWLEGRLYRQMPIEANRDYGIGIIMQMCRHTLGQELPVVAAQIQRSAPRDDTPWREALGVDVKFVARGTKLTWTLKDVKTQLVSGNPVLARLTDERAQLYVDSVAAPTVARQVADQFLELLQDGTPTQEEVASRLCMSSRTLQRRLDEEGASFVDLLRELRLDIARRSLQDPGRSIQEVAYQLGYSESSTFSRAFKRWTGHSPQSFRAQCAKEAVGGQ
jgi:AraC-like DNA-binding protein